MYYRTRHKEFGVQLQIHQNKEFAQILYTASQDERKKSISLKPGYEYTIEITPVGQKSTEGLRDLSKFRRKCLLDYEVNENSIFKIYSKANCMYECEVEKAYEVCQCIPWDFFHELKSNGSATECDVFGRTCFQNAINAVTKDKHSCKHCIEECDMMNFYSRILKIKDLTLHGNPYLNYT